MFISQYITLVRTLLSTLYCVKVNVNAFRTLSSVPSVNRTVPGLMDVSLDHPSTLSPVLVFDGILSLYTLQYPTWLAGQSAF